MYRDLTIEIILAAHTRFGVVFECDGDLLSVDGTMGRE